MDILAARKKAAEAGRTRQAQETASAAEPPVESPEPARGPVQAPAPAGAAPALTAAHGSGAHQQPEIASPPPAGTAPAEQTATEIEILAFRLGQEEYAVPVSDVREVLKMRDLTTVPNAPDYILGVASLRGSMLPVIDLCKRLGIAPGVRDEKSRIVVVSPDDEDAGLVVDRVLGVVRVPTDAMKPAPETIEHGAEYLRGIVRRDDALYIVLDLIKAVGT